MRIALVGATGTVGRAVLGEAAGRGHPVSALSRTPGPVPSGCTSAAVDVFDRPALAAALAGHDAVVSCFNVAHVPLGDRNLYRATLEGALSVVRGTREAGVPRLLFVGGAGSLHVEPGVRLVEMAGYPDATIARMPPVFLTWLATLPAPAYDATVRSPYPEEIGGPDYVPAFVRVLDVLEHDRTLDWSYFSPPPAMVPGPRSGRYAPGDDTVPLDGPHFASITVPDAAVALVDELETPAHTHRHWTASTPEEHS